MAIPEMTDDLEIIVKLNDRPNQGNSLSSAELKALFDKGPKLIKQFINSIVIPALNKLDGAANFKGGHGELTGRDAENQHPIAAIAGLVDALSEKAADEHNHEGVYSPSDHNHDDTYLKVSGGTMTGAVTLKGIHLTEGVDYGETFPDDAKIGRIFWTPEVMEDV